MALKVSRRKIFPKWGESANSKARGAVARTRPGRKSTAIVIVSIASGTLMSTQIEKDGQIIGYIETATDGKQIAKDTRYRIRGHYDPKTNQTRDFTYRVVGPGNLLVSMLTRPY